MRKQIKRDLLELVHLIPFERHSLLEELISLQTMIRQIKGMVRKNPRDTAGISRYDGLCRRYGVLLRQVTAVVPADAPVKVREAVRVFEVDGWRHGVVGR